MDLFHNLIFGFGVAFSWQNLLYCLIGVSVGTLIGVLPGIGPLATIAMLLPITFNVAPVGALIMLAGIYYGAQYGGSTTAILINMPGESSSAVTLEKQGDGWPTQPEAYRRLALSTVNTHDLPPTAGYLADEHVDQHEHQDRLDDRGIHGVGDTGGTTLGGQSLVTRDDGDDEAVKDRLEQRQDQVVDPGERREGRDEASGCAVLEVDVEQIAGQEADKARGAREADTDENRSGHAWDDEPPNYRDTHDFHGIYLFAHGS